MRRLWLGALCLFVASGCTVLGVAQQRAAFERLASLRGTVKGEGPEAHAIVVVLLREARGGDSTGGAKPAPDVTIADHFVLERAGSFAFVVSPGRYRLGAFEDLNRDRNYDPGEPVLAGQPPFEMAPGQKRDGIELQIPRDGQLEDRYDIAALQSRTPHDQLDFSLRRFTVLGEVVSLEEKRFDQASGRLGMWNFVDFLFEFGAGIFFLETYDPDKVPVLFVHGMSGTPRSFETLIGGLDRERFQPWFFFYPSGFPLDDIVDDLTASVTDLQLRFGFEEFAVVAHSMGGLVARSFILKHAEQTGRRDAWAFVAISSPWHGSEGAAGVHRLPEGYAVYSWLDMKPGSPFVEGLFFEPPALSEPRPLPSHVDFHMIVGYRRNARSRGPSSDGVISLRSQTRIEAIEAARSLLPLDEDHMSILRSEEASRRLQAILDERFD